MTIVGMTSLALSGCYKEKQASQEAIIDQTQGRLKQMQEDLKAAEEIKNKTFAETEKVLGKSSASE